MIEKPIFVIGVERSGTTLQYSLLANHPDLYWLSRLDSLIPQNPFLTCSIRNFINWIKPNQIYLAVPNLISRSEGFIPPSECVQYWRRWFRFIDENDDNENGDDYYDASQVIDDDVVYINQDFSKRLRYMDKTRLLLKQPAFSLKIGYLNKLFTDCMFIHVIRSPYENYASLLRAKRASHKNYWGSKPPGWKSYQEADLEHQTYFHLNEMLDTIHRDINMVTEVRSRYLLIKYEELLIDPSKLLHEVLDFCNLNYSPIFDKVIERIKGQPVNRKLENIPDDIAIKLTDIAIKYGYPPLR